MDGEILLDASNSFSLNSFASASDTNHMPIIVELKTYNLDISLAIYFDSRVEYKY